MSTNKNLIKKALPKIVATVASFSILGIGFLLEGEGLKEVRPPFFELERVESSEGYALSGEGIIKTTHSPTYYEPQVTAKDDPYQETVKQTKTVELTGYSSRVVETNSQPYITASGQHVREGIVAANFLEFGTRIRIPEHFGDQVFTVQDRMNSRFDEPRGEGYDGYVDIWFAETQEAKNFGRIRGEIEILE